MKIIKQVCILMLFMSFSCSSYSPFNNRAEKRFQTNSVIKKLNLNSLAIESLKNNDTIMSELHVSLENKVDKNKVKRRLDSFLQKSYNKKELLIMLKLDREFKGSDIELDKKGEFKEHIEFKDVEEYKAFDKSRTEQIKINTTISMDSLKKERL